MATCPICSTETTTKHTETPYFVCNGCGLWFQSPLPPKILHGPHETHLAQPMPDNEKAINAALADYLFREVMGGKPGRTLDVGASYAWLAHSLGQHGCQAIAWDPSDELKQFRAEYPDVTCRYVNFEDMNTPNYHGLRLITFVHVFEHTYQPTEVLKKCRRMLARAGKLFIRMPDSCVPGIERDLTEGHFKIHPMVHSLSTIAEMCARTKTFTVESAGELRPGQRDIILCPLDAQ